MATEKRVLIIRGEGPLKDQEQRIALDGARLLIGRDAKCDVRLDHESISRRHATLLNKFGVIYLENISPTGQILKNGEPVEFCELNANEVVELGPFQLSWALESSVDDAILADARSLAGFGTAGAAMNLHEAEGKVGNGADAANNAANGGNGGNGANDIGAAPALPDFDFNAPVEQDVALSSGDDNDAASNNNNNDDGGDQNGAPGLNFDADGPALDLDGGNELMPMGLGNSVSLAPGNDAAPALATNGTELAGQALTGILKIVKGEIAGREIRLDKGGSWVVGRSARCDIQIDNPKLSRQHFRLHRAGVGFRIEDLGSANGTRLNGVAVSDSQLSSFDSIQAGPVEVQFMLLDANAQQMAPALGMARGTASAVLASFGGKAGGDSQRKTIFSPPALVGGGPRMASGGGNAFDSGFNGAFSHSATSAPQAKTADAGPLGRAKQWFGDLPPARKRIYLVVLLAVLAMAGMSQMPDPTTTGEQVATGDASTETTGVATAAAPLDAQGNKAGNNQSGGPAPASAGGNAASNSGGNASPLVGGNAAVPGAVSAEFLALPKVKQDEINDLYAKAERARAAKEWNAAFDASQKILNQVKNFKNANEILAEAQTALNDDQIGMISKSLNDVEDAAKDNQDKTQLLVQNGEKALAEKRWDDAQEAFQKALNLDPTNARATRGFSAATAKDLNFAGGAPNVQIVNEAQEAKMAEQEAIDVLRHQFQDARKRMNTGDFREALPILKDLDAKLDNRIEEFDSGVRAPASIRDEFATSTRRLQSKVKEALTTAKQQRRAEYQTQLADVEEFTNNKNYTQAREILDRIIRVEPSFEEPLELRQKLYGKIIVEAKNLYQEGLIYESVGDLNLAVEGYQKARDQLTGVDDFTAEEYFRRSVTKLKRLQR